MSIASELNNLEGNIEDSYDAVNDMGGIIPAQRNMDNLDQAIRTIPQSQGATYTAGNGIDIDANNEISIDDTVVAELSDLPGVMTGATSGTAGASGLVPAPAAGDEAKVLSGAGTWVNQPTVPTVPTKTSDLTNDGDDGVHPFLATDDVATVATSGAYSDLTGTPTIPTNTSDLTNDGSDGTSTYVEADELATVATSGDYTDLINTPSDRLYRMLVPTGTEITSNKNLNTVEFLSVGRYYCSANATVTTLTNCPTSSGFMMEVFSPLSTTIDDETTKPWCYRLRMLTTYTGGTYVQQCETTGTANVWTYHNWVRTDNVQADWNASSGLAQILNKPTIPAAQVQSNWTQTSTTAVDYIKNKPTIPTVNNATLTIQKNGTTVKTFTANASSNVTANITVPTKTQLASGGTATTTTTNLSQAPSNFDYLLVDIIDNDGRRASIWVPSGSSSFSYANAGYAQGIYKKWSGWTISGSKITRAFSAEQFANNAAYDGSFHGVQRVFGIKIP